MGLGANYLTNAAPESPSGRFLESVGSLTLRLGAASADVLSDIAESNNDAAAATDKGDEERETKMLQEAWRRLRSIDLSPFLVSSVEQADLKQASAWRAKCEECH